MNTLEEAIAGTLQPSLRATVFDIALLVDLICLDLSPRDILRCTRACRSLFLAFSPHLVKGIYITRRGTHNRVAHVLATSAEQRVQGSDSAGEQENIALAIDLTSLHTIDTVYADTFRILSLEMKTLQSDFDLAQELSKEASILQGETQSDMTALPPCLAVPPLLPGTRPCFRNLTTLRCLSLPLKISNIQKNRNRLHLVLDVIDASPRLHTLELGFMDLIVEHRTRFLDMIRCRGRRLKQLKIRDVERYRISIQMVRYLLWSCAAIESLTLDLEVYDTRSPIPPDEKLLLEALARCAVAEGAIREKDMDAFGYRRSTKETLFWRQMHPMFVATFEGMPEWHREPLVFAWKELHIPYYILSSPCYLFDIYRHCPKLEALTMPLTIVPSANAEVLSLIAEFLSRLRSLDMHRLGDAGSEKYMVDILQSVQDAIGRALEIPPAVALPLNPESRVGVYPGVQSLRIRGTRFPLTNLVKLLVSPIQTFRQSLETLVLRGCWRLQSRELQLILSSCNHLKNFEAFTFELPPPRTAPIWEHSWCSRLEQHAFDSKDDPVLDVQVDLVPVQTEESGPYSTMSSLLSGLEDGGSDTAKVTPMSWQCLKLRRLHLCYTEFVTKIDKKVEKVEKEEKINGVEQSAATAAEPMVGIPRALWQQISRLEYLEELRLCRAEWSTENAQHQISVLNAAPASALVAAARAPSSSSWSSPITAATTDPTADLATATATQSIFIRDQFREALEDWDRSLTHLRGIQLRGLWHFVDPAAWSRFKKRNASRLEWARLR